MIFAVSFKILGVGPMGFCFGPGSRYHGVRTFFKRPVARKFGLNLWLVSFDVKQWA